MKTMRAAVAVMTVGVLAACGGETSTASSPTTVEPRPPSVEAVVDWRVRAVEVTGAGEFAIEACEGDAPFLCVSRGGETIGAIELATYPAGASALKDGPAVWAAELFDTVVADRRTGCDPTYRLAPLEIEELPFAGETGFRYGFTGSTDDGIVEEVRGHGVLIGGDLHLLVLNALADDGCLAREGELPLDAVEDLTPVLAALAAGSTNLPAVDAPPAPGDPAATGWLRSRNADGRLELDDALVLSGGEAIEAAREDGQLPPDGTLPNDVYIDDDEDDVSVLQAADDLTVELYDCTAGCELRVVDGDAFLRGVVHAFGGAQPMVSLELNGGIVTAIREIYLP